MTMIEKLPAQFRRNAEAADNQGLREVAEHLRYAAREVEQAEKPEPTTLEDKTIELSEVLAWADGIWGALGTEHAPKVEEREVAVAYAINQASDPNAETRSPDPARAHAWTIAQTLEAIDNRCMAVDGPVRHTLSEARDIELQRIYSAAKAITELVPAEQKPQPQWPGAGEALAMTEASVEAQAASMATDATCECGKRPREIYAIQHSETGHREWKLATHCTECLEQMAAPATEEDIDNGAVDDFTHDMKNKLSKAREKGRSGWHDPLQCAGERLAEMLIEHVRKANPGNYVDVANLAMMLHHRREPAELLREAFQNAAPRELSTELQDVVEELQSAKALHPGWPVDPIHAAQIVQEEAGELGRACLQLSYESGKATMYDARKEAVQTAAMAVRFLEHFAVYRQIRSPMVYQEH